MWPVLCDLELEDRKQEGGDGASVFRSGGLQVGELEERQGWAASLPKLGPSAGCVASTPELSADHPFQNT